MLELGYLSHSSASSFPRSPAHHFGPAPPWVSVGWGWIRRGERRERQKERERQGHIKEASLAQYDPPHGSFLGSPSQGGRSSSGCRQVVGG